MAVIYPYGSELRHESYRPERHYMRGPGPRWREKHGRSAYWPTRSLVSAVQHEGD